MVPDVKIAWEVETDLFEIKNWGENKVAHTLTREEFETLQQLMPATQWIVVLWTPPPTRETINQNQ